MKHFLYITLIASSFIVAAEPESHPYQNTRSQRNKRSHAVMTSFNIDPDTEIHLPPLTPSFQSPFELELHAFFTKLYLTAQYRGDGSAPFESSNRRPISKEAMQTIMKEAQITTPDLPQQINDIIDRIEYNKAHPKTYPTPTTDGSLPAL